MINIRPATIDDMIRCEELFHTPDLMTPGGNYLTAELISRYLDEAFFLVAEKDGMIVGAVYGEELKGEGVILWLISVDQNYRGQEIGTQLMQAFEQNCRKLRKAWIYLLATAEDEKIVAFYRKNGFDKGILNYECAKMLEY